MNDFLSEKSERVFASVRLIWCYAKLSATMPRVVHYYFYNLVHSNLFLLHTRDIRANVRT